MAYDVRALTPADSAAAWDLGSIAFGYRDRTMPPEWTPDPPGRHTWGVFDEDRLVAKVVDREQGHWFGGRMVLASGVAGVATTPELRGQGLARLALTRLLAEARGRGALISTLFPTTPFPYRSLGWEVCGALTWIAVPTATLAGFKAPPGIQLRAARPEDVPKLRELYREMARDSAAVMDRVGPAWDRYDDADYLGEYDGVTLAEDRVGAVLGYVSWNRQPGYDSAGALSVDDFVSTTPPATHALLSMLGGWAAVAPTIRMKAAAIDPVLLATAIGGVPVVDRRPWMLRLIDAPAAVAARGWPTPLRGEASIELVDSECPWNAGSYRLILEGGEGRLEPGGSGALRLPPRALALWYAGAATPDVMRRAGLLSGEDKDGESLLRAATAGPAPLLLDYF